MARPVLALLVLVCLVVACECTFEGQMGQQLRTPECRKLLKVFKKCGVTKHWTNQLQKDLAAVMSQVPFHEDLNGCLAMSLDMGTNQSYCKDEPSMRVYLQCSRMALVRRVDVKNKYAAIKFHGGYDHCVKVRMGMLGDFGGMPLEVGDDDDDDDDDRDGGKVRDDGQNGGEDKTKASMTQGAREKRRIRRHTPTHETEEMVISQQYPDDYDHSSNPDFTSMRREESGTRGGRHRRPERVADRAPPGRVRGRGPDDFVRRRPYDRLNRHRGRPYEGAGTMTGHRRTPSEDDDDDGGDDDDEDDDNYSSTSNHVKMRKSGRRPHRHYD
ncbi:uncharacterized protein LOC142590975 [Dermacentor variabilis]|uniref:uncharacterized protein LOC142590975 n=1 Tax=Dermacentor variabilis TaxID=34621 RepID=UPI003F5B4326